MKKRLLAAFLLVCLLVGALCVPTGAKEEASAQSEYDYSSLYVQDGLVQLFEAYAGSDTVDLTAGKWSAAIGGGTATLANANGAISWYLGAKGGVGYDLTFNTWNTVTKTGAQNAGFGVVLDPSYIPAGDYTIELVASHKSLLNEDGSYYINTSVGQKWGLFTRAYSPIAFGHFKMMGFVGKSDSTAEGMQSAVSNKGRWQYCKIEWGSHSGKWVVSGVESSLLDDEAYSLQVTCQGAVWTVYQNGGKLGSHNSAAKPLDDGSNDRGGNFHVLYGSGGSVYALRVYNRALSQEESLLNHFVDISWAVGADMTAYVAATDAEKALIHQFFAGASVETSLEDYNRIIDIVLGEQAGGSLPNDLYVTDGLQLFLTAMPGYENTAILTGGTGVWRSANGDLIPLAGSTWFVGENGGLGYRLTRSQYGMESGLVLGKEWLPTGSYSVEMVLSVEGLVDNNGNRYVDTTSNYGTYHDFGIAIGPLKTCSFVSLRKAEALDGFLENRFIYHNIGGWKASGCKTRFLDTTIRTENPEDIISFSIHHKFTPSGSKGSSRYSFVGNGKALGGFSVIPYDYFATTDTEEYFNLMYRFPCTFYAVRLYDRELTQAEQDQNHVADLIAYYGLDTAFMDETRSVVGDVPELYAALRTLGFQMEKSEIQKAFDTALEAVWMEAVGVSIRLDSKVGIRGVFSLSDGVTETLEAKGYRVEAGIGFAVGKVETLDACGTLVETYASETGKNMAFYIGDSEFALNVNYVNCERQEFLEELTFIGYLRAFDGEGEVVYDLRCPLTVDSFELTAYAAYQYQMNNAYSGNSFVKKMVNNCYEDKDFYVSVDGDDATADGSEDAPYASLDAAYRAICELLTQNALPVNVNINLGEGVHRLSNTMTFDSANFDPALVRLNFLGEGADATTVTGNQEIDSSLFKQVEGKPYYAYQFEKDENGTYPEFRYLYVDGAIAPLAHEGSRRAANCDQYVTKFWRLFNNGITPREWKDSKELPASELSALQYEWRTTRQPTAPKFYLASELFEGIKESDLSTLELHMEVQWKFNIVKVENIDWEDTLNDGALVAVYVNSEQYYRMQGPANETYFNRPYWIENALYLLNEPGEFFYNQAKGILYYYPEEGKDIEDITFEIPQTERIMSFKNVNDVKIEGITFTGVDHLHTSKYGYCAGQAGGESKYGYLDLAVIAVDDTERFEVNECIFNQVAGDAINMRGRLRNITLYSNQFFQIGATAIRVGVYGISKWTEENSIKDLLIEDNYLDGIAWYLRESNALLVSQAVDVEILNNTIQNCSYSAMSIGVQAGAAGFSHTDDVYNLRNVEIAYNYITNFMTDMRDGGAIYTLGGNAEPDYHEPLNFIHHNYIVWSKITGDAQGKSHTSGLYNDNSSSNWHDYNNVQILNPNRYWPGMYFHYVQSDATHSILIEDNYYAYCTSEDRDEQFKIIYRNVNPDKNHSEIDTTYVTSPDRLSGAAIAIAESSGSSWCPPNFDDVLTPDF